MRRRAFIRTAAGLFVPAITGLAQVPLSVGDPAFLGRRRSAAQNCTGQGATWAAQVVTNGGASPSSTTICAFDTFWSALVTAGIDSKMIAVNCYAPDSLIASITPLYKSSGNTPWTNHNFVSGDLTVNGLKGDRTTKYLDTGIVPSSAFSNLTSAGISVYISANIGSNDSGEVGCYDGSTFLLDVDYTGGTLIFDTWNFTSGAGRLTTTGYANWTGFMSGNRTASNAVAIYKASSGVSFATAISGSGSGGSRPTNSIFVHGLDLSGSLGSGSERRLSYVSIHTGLTSGEAEAEYNAVQAMRTSLGGGYV